MMVLGADRKVILEKSYFWAVGTNYTILENIEVIKNRVMKSKVALANQPKPL